MGGDEGYHREGEGGGGKGRRISRERRGGQGEGEGRDEGYPMEEHRGGRNKGHMHEQRPRLKRAKMPRVKKKIKSMSHILEIHQKGHRHFAREIT